MGIVGASWLHRRNGYTDYTDYMSLLRHRHRELVAAMAEWVHRVHRVRGKKLNCGDEDGGVRRLRARLGDSMPAGFRLLSRS